MYYQVSQDILSAINNSGKILINCHKDPDPDSIGSALAFAKILKNIGKDVEVLSVSPDLYEPVSYLPGYDLIKRNIDYKAYDFSDHDLFIVLDSSSVERVVGENGIDKIPIKTIMIDHHKTNDRFGNINLVDEKSSSSGELSYCVFRDCQFEIDRDTADCLIAAIVGDTGAFRFPATTTRTLDIARDLIQRGADKDLAVQKIYRSENFDVIKFWGEVLTRMQLNKDGKYVWSAVPYDVFEKCGKPRTGKESAASAFTQIVDDTDFGFVAVEEQKGNLKISLRSRTGFDTTLIASELGGGGHIYASGAGIKGMDFDEAVSKLLSVCDKYSAK